jgi:hypothetical protein
MTRKGRLCLQRRKRQVDGNDNSDGSNSEMSGTEDEEDDKGEKLDRIEEEDEVASNTAEAEEDPVVVNLETTEDPTKVESNLPSAFMAEDNTIKVEETGDRQDPVDEAVYLLDLFADENAKYLDKIINRRKGQNVRYI